MRQAGDIQRGQAESATSRSDLANAHARPAAGGAERRLALEHEVSRVLTRAADLDDALHGVLRAVRDGLDVHVCALWLPDDDGALVRCVRCLAADRMPALAAFVESTRRTTFAAGEGMPGRVWATGRPEWLDRVDDPGFRRRPAALASGLRAGAALPLHDASNCIGVIEWFSCEDLAREDAVLATMEAVGTDLAQFLRRAMAERKLRQRNDRLTLIARASADLVLREAGEPGVLGDVFRDVARALDYELMFHYEGDGAGLRLVASDGLDAAEREAFARIASGEHLCGRVAQRREALVVEDLPGSSYAEAAALCSAGVLCYIGVPLVAQDELVGTVSFATRRRARAGEGDLQLIRTIADLAAVQLARARSEQRLRDRETHLRLALEASHAVAFEWDVVNDRVRHLQQSGLPAPLPGECGFADVLALVHPDDRSAFCAGVDAALASATGDYAAEFRHLLPDGRVRWIAERGRVEFDASGRALRLIGVAHDITERRQSEDALRTSEARYRHMFEGNPQPMWVFDAQTLRFLAVNDAAIAKYGYARQEFLAMSIADIRPAEDLPRLKAMVSEAPPARLAHAGDWRHRRKDGTLIDVEITTHGIEFGGRPARLVLVHDVTERKRAERELRESEERFASMADGTPVPIWVTDPDGSIQFVNRAYCEFFGATQDGVKHGGWVPFVHTDDADAYLERFRAALAARSPFHAQVRVRAAGGEWRWIESFGAPRFSAAGEFLGMAGSSPDVTLTKQTEAALAASEERLQLAMLAGNAGTWDLDLVSGRNVWSESHFTILGLSPTPDREATEAMWRDAILPEDRPRMLAAWERAQRERDVYRCEMRLRRANDGALIWVQTAGRFLYDPSSGDAVRFVGVMFDVTLEKLAEEALRESEEQLRLALEASSTGLWRWDVATDEVHWSPETHALVGLDATVAPTARRFLAMIHPADHGRVLAASREAIAQRTTFECEYRLVQADGAVVWVTNHGRARYDEAGRAVAMIGTIAVITQRKQHEEALKEADRRKDEFLAMLAHELRNPLAPIRNATELLRLAGPKDGTIAAARGMIERQVGHMVRLVDDLLDVSRVSRGKITLESDTLDLAAVVRQAIETSRPPIDARRHHLAVSMPAEPVRVRGDFTRLAQVIANLLDNAAKYTAPGGRIDVIVEREGEGANARAVVRVRDTGRGVDAATIPHLFELFYQADRNLDRTEGGLGIGLSLVKSLVDMHGGEVEARSEGLGMGSEFVVRLPLAAPPGTTPRAPRQSVATPSPHGLRVLVVDDNRDSAESTALLLRSDGHEVTTVYDGRRAVEVAVQDKPAVVLLDLGLPTLDGYEACRAMRAAGLTETLIVTMTGYGQDEDRRRSQEAGFDAHHVKPIELDALRALIASRSGHATIAPPDGRPGH